MIDKFKQTRNLNIDLFVPCGRVLSNGEEGSCSPSDPSIFTRTPAPSSDPSNDGGQPEGKAGPRLRVDRCECLLKIKIN